MTLNIQIERFGGNINPSDNSINLIVAVNLSAEVEGQKLSKFIELPIPPDQTEIYDLLYLLQPLVYQYCQAELSKPPDTTEA